jgi:tetratricopeptide (TPR) repeat protein
MESLRLIRSKSPQHLPIDLATLAPSVISTGPSSEIQEIDLSEDWELFLAQRAKSSQGQQAPQKAPSPQSREGDETVQEPSPEDDPEAHYNLGVAFWEMNLPDEAIRELQQVVKGAGIRPQPPNYLEACTLLATCFMDKGMASVAVRWYARAMQAPHIDEDAWLALHYDLGVAYERTGDLPRAWEEFSEVYSRNIAFRDVAEKVRTFQQKGSSR